MEKDHVIKSIKLSEFVNRPDIDQKYVRMVAQKNGAYSVVTTDTKKMLWSDVMKDAKDYFSGLQPSFYNIYKSPVKNYSYGTNGDESLYSITKILDTNLLVLDYSLGELVKQDGVEFLKPPSLTLLGDMRILQDLYKDLYKSKSPHYPNCDGVCPQFLFIRCSKTCNLCTCNANVSSIFPNFDPQGIKYGKMVIGFRPPHSSDDIKKYVDMCFNATFLFGKILEFAEKYGPRKVSFFDITDQITEAIEKAGADIMIPKINAEYAKISTLKPIEYKSGDTIDMWISNISYEYDILPPYDKVVKHYFQAMEKAGLDIGIPYKNIKEYNQ